MFGCVPPASLVPAEAILEVELQMVVRWKQNQGPLGEQPELFVGKKK